MKDMHRATAAARASVVRKTICLCGLLDTACPLPEIEDDERCAEYHGRCLRILARHTSLRSPLRWCMRRVSTLCKRILQRR